MLSAYYYLTHCVQGVGVNGILVICLINLTQPLRFLSAPLCSTAMCIYGLNLSTSTITGMHGAEYKRQPAAAKHPCWLVARTDCCLHTVLCNTLSPGTRQLDALRAAYIHHLTSPALSTDLRRILSQYPLHQLPLHIHPR